MLSMWVITDPSVWFIVLRNWWPRFWLTAPSQLSDLIQSKCFHPWEVYKCIHDNYMMVQQTIKLLHRRKVPSLFLKLDISKAFDSFSWSFLLELLHYLGFGWLWCNLISNLLTTSSARIILNGEPSESINHQQGLRQGNPLSPVLFILAIDVLNGLLVKKAGEEGFLQPLSNHSAGDMENGSLYMETVLPYSYSQ